MIYGPKITEVEPGMRFEPEDAYACTKELMFSDSILTVLAVLESDGINSLYLVETHHGQKFTCRFGWLNSFWRYITEEQAP